MIVVSLTFRKIISEFSFLTLSDALEFARATEVGTSFQIREGKTLLAKGKIEKIKG